MDKQHIVLHDIAHARSGDKGAHANIGIIANNAAAYEYIVAAVTSSVVADYFSQLQPSSVERFTLPNLHALNFVLKDILGKGGSLSLRVDAQGKALAQAILLLQLPRPNNFEEMIK